MSRSIKYVSTLLTLFFLILNVASAREAGRNFFKNVSKIENPFELRDPFKSPLKRSFETKKVKNKKGYKEGNTLYGGFRINWAKVTLGDLRVVGTIVGNNRRALVKVPNNEDVVLLREGMVVGPDRAELKAILPSGIVFVERIINVYGQPEFLETVIPVSR